jgi:hypothetical protein
MRIWVEHPGSSDLRKPIECSVAEEDGLWKMRGGGVEAVAESRTEVQCRFQKSLHKEGWAWDRRLSDLAAAHHFPAHAASNSAVKKLRGILLDYERGDRFNELFP